MELIGVQYDIVWEEKEENFHKVERMLEEGDIKPESFIVLPEMFATGFSMNSKRIAEGRGGQTEQFLASVATKHKAYVLGGLAIQEGTEFYNQAVGFGPDGREVVRYSKMHPFSYAKEDLVYAKGDSVRNFRVGELCVAPFVCYDLRFPECFRHATKGGANIFVVIANWPKAREEHWMTLLKARAIENLAYVIGVNRVGKSPKLEYNGRSLIIGPRGQVLADGGGAECLVRATADARFVAACREEFPAISDIRWDMLGLGE